LGPFCAKETLKDVVQGEFDRDQDGSHAGAETKDRDETSERYALRSAVNDFKSRPVLKELQKLRFGEQIAVNRPIPVMPGREVCEGRERGKRK